MGMTIKDLKELNKQKGIATAVINSYKDFFVASEELMYSGFFISRGHRELSWKLFPSVFRPEVLEKTNIPDRGGNYESTLTTEFQDRYFHYIDLKINSSDETSILLAMQHYGVYTRLLDWTLNPQTSLFFAMNFSDESNSDSLIAAIWYLNPEKYRNMSGGPKKGSVYVRQMGSEVSKRSHIAFQRKQEEVVNPKNQLPIFFIPKYLFPRIVAQESIFSIHGHQKTSLEDISNAGEFLRCLIIEDLDKSFWKYVNNVLKLDYEKYFPDIYGFTEGMRRANRK